MSSVRNGERINAAVTAVHRRLVIDIVARYTIAAAVATAPVSLVLAYTGWRSLAVVVSLAGLLAAVGTALVRAPKRSTAIVALDRACDAGELIVTAAAIADGRSSGGRFASFILTDAETALDAVTPGAVARLDRLAVALGVTALALTCPWLVAPPRGLSHTPEAGATKTLVPAKASSARPGQGEIVRRGQRQHTADGELATDPNARKPNLNNPVPINPAVPGHVADRSGGGAAAMDEPSAGAGAGEGKHGVDRRNQPAIPFALQRAAATSIDVTAARGGRAVVSAAVPPAYRQLVADIVSKQQ